MVTIINGEIVADDDPRAQEYRRRKNKASISTDRSSVPQRREASPQQQQVQVYGQRNPRNQGAGQDNGPSLYYEISNRLLDLGFPRLNFLEF